MLFYILFWVVSWCLYIFILLFLNSQFTLHFYMFFIKQFLCIQCYLQRDHLWSLLQSVSPMASPVTVPSAFFWEYMTSCSSFLKNNQKKIPPPKKKNNNKQQPKTIVCIFKNWFLQQLPRESSTSLQKYLCLCIWKSTLSIKRVTGKSEKLIPVLNRSIEFDDKLLVRIAGATRSAAVL